MRQLGACVMDVHGAECWNSLEVHSRVDSRAPSQPCSWFDTALAAAACSRCPCQEIFQAFSGSVIHGCWIVCRKCFDLQAQFLFPQIGRAIGVLASSIGRGARVFEARVAYFFFKLLDSVGVMSQ